MLKKILLTTIIIFASGISYASIFAPDAMTGFYLSPVVGYGKANNGDSLKNQSTSSKEGGFAVHPSAGYLFNQYWGITLGYLGLPTNKYTINGLDYEVDNYAIDGYVILALPLGDFNNFLNRWSIFGKLGAAYTKTTGALEGSGYSPAYGAGIDFKLNSKFSLVASWQQINGDKTPDHPTDDFYGFGLIVKFG